MLNRFHPILAAAALVATPTFGKPLKLPSPDLQFALHCSAAFALAERDQRSGAPGATDYPPMAVRGRDFFVDTGLRLAKELELDQDELQFKLRSEVGLLKTQLDDTTDRRAAFFKVMQPCITLLDATIPADAGRAR